MPADRIRLSDRMSKPRDTVLPTAGAGRPRETYQRRTLRPSDMPAATSMLAANGYQVATKSGESSMQWAA
ncbi:hypothetical protein GCM10011335_06380 [Aureimonas glaciei]|uniref:Uncharacterized protein n=1 Tax=Aureimonas glaciei TaxID=1776957 RepID=A0A916XTB6_9HYPH|nr:hypothetical protein GCM10011335_06380 [Aureimonas glaciei]